MAGEARISIMPTLRYRDARRMIDWLEQAFGFSRHVVHDTPEGDVAHAQLTFGNGMIMLGQARDDDYGRLCRTPADLGGTTQGPYVIVADADAQHARAVAAGARIVRPLETTSYGSREFSALDPEGHLWNFGTYDPFA
ncbi:MAG: VOC family protein [Hyphomicrobiaceae bacterium]